MLEATAHCEDVERGLGKGVGLIDPLRNHQWDRFVAQHPFGWITHLSGWKKVLDQAFPHMHGYYLALHDSQGGIAAALPIYSVQSWLTGRRLVSIPFATLCDPLVSGPAEMERLLAAVLRLSERMSIPRIEIRTLAASHLLESDDFSIDCGYKHHFLSLDGDPDRIRSSFHRSCVRQRIVRAEQSGLRMVRGRSEAELKQFYLLHCRTRKRKGLPPHPYRLLKSLWSAFAWNNMLELLLCYKEGLAVAGLILFKYKDRVSIEYSSADASYNECSPIHLLLWNTIRESCLAGYRVLDFGQTSVYNKSLMEFKSHWGTQVADLPHFIYPPGAGDAAAVGKATAKKLLHYICNKAPDSALTRLGQFCYRHLG